MPSVGHSLKEVDVKRAVVHRLRALGCIVGSVGNRGKSQLPAGWPDLTVIPPYRFRSGPPYTGVFFVELKREQGGTVSDAQRTFQADCAARGVTCVIGGWEEVETHLKATGVIP